MGEQKGRWGEPRGLRREEALRHRFQGGCKGPWNPNPGFSCSGVGVRSRGLCWLSVREADVDGKDDRAVGEVPLGKHQLELRYSALSS